MITPETILTGFVLLPELKLLYFGSGGLWTCEKKSEAEVCPRCATLSKSVYDHRWVHIRDEAIHGDHITLKILKRRFWCKISHKRNRVISNSRNHVISWVGTGQFH